MDEMDGMQLFAEIRKSIRECR
ncbi:hypothetical protein ACNKHT_16565 [Shigella flexneri]